MILSYSEAIDYLVSRANGFNCKNKPLVIAIDGRSASGKTTFAKLLQEQINAPVVHTDDFFRPRNQSGVIDMSEFDGNFDIKRFKAEVVDNIHSNHAIEYGVFDCSSGRIVNNVKCAYTNCIIIEGAYSLNPVLGNYADIKLFFDVSKEEQKARIISRNGAERCKAFESVWIPAEERYFLHYDIQNNCDITVNTTI